jgi:hypothetical protein
MSSAAAEKAEEGAKKRGVDWLEWFKAVAIPLAAVILGFVFNSSLNERQRADSDSRLYADMMGRREDADSSLRKDMLKSILDTFLKQTPGQPREEFLDQEVLNTELLAYNFHESLDLGPLFQYMQRQVAADKTNRLLARLERVASDVKERQLALVGDSGAVERGDINLNTGVFAFGGAELPVGAHEKRGGPTLCLSIDSISAVSTVRERHYRQFKLEFIDYSKPRREAQFSLSVSKPLTEADCRRIQPIELEQKNLEAQATFWVGLFAFPMIDNTRLSMSERCSVSVNSLTDDDNATVSVAFFQAARASVKDKLYYDEIMNNLLHGSGRRAN